MKEKASFGIYFYYLFRRGLSSRDFSSRINDMVFSAYSYVADQFPQRTPTYNVRRRVGSSKIISSLPIIQFCTTGAYARDSTFYGVTFDFIMEITLPAPDSDSCVAR